MAPEMDFKGKIVVVTGAANGIGKAIAIRFAKAGAEVVLADITNESQVATATSLRASGLKAHAYKCDVSSDDEVARFGEAVMTEVGVPDIIYNNAVFIRTGNIINVSLENMRRELDVNILGYIRIVKAFIPRMISRGDGWIINTASPNGIAPPPMLADNFISYCLCKAADISMSQSMSVTLKPLGISVSVVLPDITYTETVEDLSGSSSIDFQKGFAQFLQGEGKSAAESAEKIFQKLNRHEFLANAYPGFEDVMVKAAQVGMDPNAIF